MTEPIYSFVKGQGWILNIESPVLTEDDCRAYVNRYSPNTGNCRYPEPCRTWNIIDNCRELKVGDIIPYGQSVDIVYKIENRIAYVHRVSLRQGETPRFRNGDPISAFSAWDGVARRE